jgi:group I intron endonuclease
MILFDTGIYKLTHKESDKVYIGQSKHLKRRLNEHKRCEKSDDKKGSQSVIRRAIKKYSFDAFDFEIILYCQEGEYMDMMETKLIQFYDCLVPKGYNVRDGGNKKFISEEGRKRISEANSGRIVSEETRKKLSDSGKEHYLNNPRGDEWNQKLSIALTGKKKTEDHKLKLSEHRKEFIKNNPDSCKNFLGKQHSDETKKLMSEKHFGILHTNESKLKMSDMAKNRKRVYQEDGSWKWGKLCL